MTIHLRPLIGRERHRVKIHLKTIFSQLSTFLEGSKYLSGETITFVDFMLWEFLDHLEHFDSSLFDDSRVSNLKTFKNRIENLPKVADYLQEWIIFEFELIYAH